MILLVSRTRSIYSSTAVYLCRLRLTLSMCSCVMRRQEGECGPLLHQHRNLFFALQYVKMFFAICEDGPMFNL